MEVTSTPSSGEQILSELQQQSRASSASLTDRASELGKNEFVQLLMAQIQNQDPLNPMEGYEFAAQLAQFSSVEQLVNINDTLGLSMEATGVLTQATNSGIAAGMIGQTVEAVSNQAPWDGEEVVQLGFDLSSPADNVSVEILNANGEVIRTLDLGARDAETHRFEWDGRDGDGKKLPEGAYSFRVNATDAEGESLTSLPFVTGRVDRVSFDQDGTRLWIGDVSIPLGQVRGVESAAE
ncbi:MAG: FlgD immunoglobulin-like domain containing protein [Bacteroidota bacterium]